VFPWVLEGYLLHLLESFSDFPMIGNGLLEPGKLFLAQGHGDSFGRRPGATTSFAQRAQEKRSIRLPGVNVGPPVATSHHVVKAPANSRRVSRGTLQSLSTCPPPVTNKRLTPVPSSDYGSGVPPKILVLPKLRVGGPAAISRRRAQIREAGFDGIVLFEKAREAPLLLVGKIKRQRFFPGSHVRTVYPRR
jgi:hypothetical protein